MAFLTLVICNLGMILSNRSLTKSSIRMLREKNTAFKWVMTGTTAAMALLLTVPFLKTLFRFGAVSLDDLILALVGGAVAIALMELLKVAPYFHQHETFQQE